MSDESGAIRSQADARFEAALEKAGARDPRDFYRTQLLELRKANPDGYRAAVRYFEKELVPAVARADSDPIAEWLEYGRLLASLRIDGSTVMIDPSGLARPYARPVPQDDLVLHLPTSTREGALAVGLPPNLSPAQTATYHLLVSRSGG